MHAFASASASLEAQIFGWVLNKLLSSSTDLSFGNPLSPLSLASVPESIVTARHRLLAETLKSDKNRHGLRSDMVSTPAACRCRLSRGEVHAEPWHVLCDRCQKSPLLLQPNARSSLGSLTQASKQASKAKQTLFLLNLSSRQKALFLFATETSHLQGHSRISFLSALPFLLPPSTLWILVAFSSNGYTSAQHDGPGSRSLRASH